MTLIERLEAATEGSRELDAEVDRAIILPKEIAGSVVQEWFLDGEQWGCNTADGYRHLAWMPLGKWTRSLDAALSLVPEGCAWRVGCAIDFTPEATVYGHNIHADVDAATPALALCIASLKARSAP